MGLGSGRDQSRKSRIDEYTSSPSDRICWTHPEIAILIYKDVTWFLKCMLLVGNMPIKMNKAYQIAVDDACGMDIFEATLGVKKCKNPNATGICEFYVREFDTGNTE